MPVFSRSVALISIVLALITACGSQESSNTNNPAGASKTANDITSTSTSGQTDSGLLQSLAALYPNGQLPAARTAQASLDLTQNPAALKLTAETVIVAKGQSTTNTANTPIAAQAVAADYLPVQRIQNTTLYGAYFFSIYPTEIATALATNPNWRLEGPAFWASLATGADLHPVHRFRNKTNGSYLYSIYDTERADIATNYAATFEYEGVAWYARQTPATGWSALYRFRNKTNGTYLFSAYESEKDAIVATYPDVFALEGTAYYVRQDAPDDTAPVITVLGDTPQSLTAGTAYVEAGASCTDNKDTTCTVVTTGTVNTASVGTYTITYTATDASGNTSSKTRRVNVIAGIPPVVPDTTAPTITVLGTNPLNLSAGTAYTEAGATCVDNKDAICTVVTTGTVNTATAGSYTITYTATDAAGNITSKTRGVTVAACTAAAIGSTGYSLVFKGCSAANVAEYYDKTECVRDNATGLIWQGHTLTGLRSTSNIYSNYDSTTVLQKWNGATMVAPTQLEIDAATNSIGFKNAVNATNLCGSNNWRLPSYTELLTIVKPGHYSTGAYNYDREWFPNSNADFSNDDAYWTSTADSIDAAKAWFVAFNGWGYGWALGRGNNESWAGVYGDVNVRLVK